MPRRPWVRVVETDEVPKTRIVLGMYGRLEAHRRALSHGQDLNGIGLVPGLAGRSPSDFVRQMYDMREGSRNGVATAMMKPVVANLTVAGGSHASHTCVSIEFRDDARPDRSLLRRRQQCNPQFADVDNDADNNPLDRRHDHDYTKWRVSAIGDRRGWFACDVRE